VAGYSEVALVILSLTLDIIAANKVLTRPCPPKKLVFILYILSDYTTVGDFRRTCTDLKLESSDIINYECEKLFILNIRCKISVRVLNRGRHCTGECCQFMQQSQDHPVTG